MFLFTISRHLRLQSTRKRFASVQVIVVVRKEKKKRLTAALLFYSDVFRFAFAQLPAYQENSTKVIGE